MRLWSKKQQNALPVRRRGRGNAQPVRSHPDNLEARYSFRRNRTLTGSLVSEVASASEHTAQLKSSRVQTHDLRRHRRRLTWALFGVVAASAGFFFLIWDSIMTPHVILSQTSSGLTFDAQIYDNAIQTYLTKHPSQRFRFSLNREQLSSYLQSNGYPEVSAVDQNVLDDGFGAKQIRVSMRRPTVVWTTGGTELYVDGTGVAFKRNYYSAPAVSVVDQSGIQAKNNQVLVSNRFLAFIGKLTGAVALQGQTVTQMIIPANTTRQVEMVLSGLSYPIKVSVDRPVGEQAEDAKNTVAYMAKHGITPEYIDVRVSGRAYYK